MKLNSPESIATAEQVFREYGFSWSAARDAGTRDSNGVLVIPRHRTEGVGSPAATDRTASGQAR